MEGVSSVKTGKKQAVCPKSGKFSKGKSGNPKGRPKGARNKARAMPESC